MSLEVIKTLTAKIERLEERVRNSEQVIFERDALWSHLETAPPSCEKWAQQVLEKVRQLSKEGGGGD